MRFSLLLIAAVGMLGRVLQATAGLKGSNVNRVRYNSVTGGVTALRAGHGSATTAYYGLVNDEVVTSRLRIIGVTEP